MKYLHYPLYCRGGSGLSNLVMSCEVGVAASFLLDRVLVIEGNITPPANVVEYQEQGVNNRHRARITDLIDLPVSWVDAERVDYDPSDAFVMSEGKLMHAVFVWPPELDTSTEDFRFFARERALVVTERRQSREAPVVRLFPSSPDGHSRENLGFYSYFFYLDEPTRRVVHALLRRMQPQPPFAELASRVSASLGEFNAVHIRRGDFKKTFGTTTRDRRPAEAIRVLEASFGVDETLLILTDEREDPFFAEITRQYPNSIFIDDHILQNHREAFFELPFHDSITLAYLSQLVAADSQDFVGTMTSTYSSMVQRYRGNRGREERFKFLWNEIPDPERAAKERGSHLPSDCVPLHSDGSLVEEHEGPYSWNRVNARINPAWQREWPESFLSGGGGADTVSDELMAGFHARRQVGAGESRSALVPESIRPGEREYEVSEPKVGATLVEVILHLSGGQDCRTELPSDSEILRELFEALANGTAGAAPFAPKLLQVPTDGGKGAYSFWSQRLVAIETSPPVLIEAPAADAEAREAPERPPKARQEPLQGSARPARRSPPVVHEVPRRRAAAYQPLRDFDALPFVQVPDFLTPDEQRQLLESTLAAEASFAKAPGYSTCEVADSLEAALAERIAERLQLLLPQVLPAFDLSRPVRAGELQLCAHRDGDVLEAGSASAASPSEITCTYYFHRDPKSLSGGELRFREGDEVHLVEPRNNAVLIYPTAARDEAMPLRCPSKAFADSRFAVTARIA